METIKCPNVQTRRQSRTLSDKAYKLSCPVLLDELGRRGGTAPDVDCPHLGPLMRMTALRLSTKRKQTVTLLPKTRRPLNVIHGCARFAKFNRVRDNSGDPLYVITKKRIARMRSRRAGRAPPASECHAIPSRLALDDSPDDPGAGDTEW
jgi:hypothetical protein